MCNVTKTVKFKQTGNDFTTQLSKDLKSLEANEKIILFADKSTNLYKMEKDDYIKLCEGKTAKYIGLTEGDFKTRYKIHVKSFKHIKYKTETELSKQAWSLKEKNYRFKIKWKTLTKATPYRCGSKRCGLCITEKMHIALVDSTCINKRDEFVSRCRHRHKYKLNCVK